MIEYFCANPGCKNPLWYNGHLKAFCCPDCSKAANKQGINKNEVLRKRRGQISGQNQVGRPASPIKIVPRAIKACGECGKPTTDMVCPDCWQKINNGCALNYAM